MSDLHGTSIATCYHTMQLEDLPYELVLKILHYLPIADLKNLSSTSKSCFKLAEDPRLWDKATLHVKNDSPRVLTAIRSPRFKLIQSLKIHLKLQNLNELIKQILCHTFINHLSLYTLSLNHLIKGPPEDEIVILRSDGDDLIRGIHFSKLKPYPRPKKPPKQLSIPLKTNHSQIRLQQISISEAGITKNQLLELLSAIDRENGTSITSISLETSVHLPPRSKETLIVGLTKILFGLSARLCSLYATNESLNSLKVKQTCTVHTINSSLTFSYRANNGLVPCLDIFSALLNIKGKLDSLNLSVAGVETNAILIRAQDQYEYE